MRSFPRLLVASPLLVAPGLLLAASAPAVQAVEPLSTQLERATAEARAAEAEVQRLERAAGEARGRAEQLRARQAAAAEAIAAAEARISAADARMRLIAAQIAARRERLAEQQAPAGALLAGLALMASRPPLVSILDEGSTDEFVRIRLLLDSTLPEIRRRTAALSDEIDRGRTLQRAAEAAREDMLRQRQALDVRRQEFAALEEQVLQLAEERGAQALGAGDVALARSEEADALSRAEQRGRAAEAIAAELAAAAPAAPRPVRPESEPETAELRYMLPAHARVTEGLGSVSAAGIRSRGITLATRRGAAVKAPASGVVRFAGPFRTYDGIVIIDHGQGWISLITNISARLEPGAQVELGQPLGRALGPIGVELSRNGHRVSPALIAGSSQIVSKRAKQG